MTDKTPEQEFAAALVEFQKALPHVGKDSKADTGKFSYTYAALPDIFDAVLLMTLLPADVDAALYAELVPHRISRPPSLHTGPTEQFRRLELQRLAWRVAHPGMVDGVAVAAS